MKGPRANCSKKSLPPAFFPSGENRHARHRGAEAALGLPHEAPTGAGAEVWDRRETVRLDSLVFLCLYPQRHGHFAMKKMLQPATLELFCLVELPGAERQRAALCAFLQDWLRSWYSLQDEHPEHLVAVREAFWDVPHGYPMGILCEYMPLGSLHDLLQACGGLPEEVLREIAHAMLSALHLLHSANPPMVHGCLKPSQVLFDANGHPRLAFGLEYRVKWFQAEAGGDVNAVTLGDDGHGLGGALHSWAQIEQTTAVDIFDFGLLLLVSALGGHDVLMDAIPSAREFRASASRMESCANDTCSFLQQELVGVADVGAGPPEEMGYLPPASDLLFNRQYSTPFLAFVTSCLQAHSQAPPVSAWDLLQHDFLRTPPGGAVVGPLVTLREMQSIARVLNEAPAEPEKTRFGREARSFRTSHVPGVAPLVTQSARLYLTNIAQSIAPYCGGSFRGGAGSHIQTRAVLNEVLGDQPPSWRRKPGWDVLLLDTARTVGLSQPVVRNALEAQLERLMQTSAREPKD